MNTTIKIRKKNGQLQDFDFTKIVDAVNKSAERVNIKIDEDFKSLLMDKVLDRIKDLDIIGTRNA